MSIVGGLRYALEDSFWAKGRHLSRDIDHGALIHESAQAYDIK